MALFMANGMRCSFQEGRWDGDVNEKADAKGAMKVVYNIPLDMWRNKAMEVPYLAQVAHRVLAIPARQAQSERTVSTAGLTVNKRCGERDPKNAELLFFSGATGRL